MAIPPSAPPVRVIVVNGDPNWPFARLVRQHAPDLLQQKPAIEFWQLADTDTPRADRLSVWRDWPALKHAQNEALGQDLIDRVPRSEREAALFLFVLSEPERFGAQPDLPIREQDLEELRAYLQQDPRRKSRVHRVLVFRCRPAHSERDWIEERVATAYGLLKKRLVDDICFLAADAGPAPEASDFAGLRVLVELFSDDEHRRKLRPSGREETAAVRWFRSFPHEPRTQVGGARALITRVVGDFERGASGEPLPQSAATAETEGVETLQRRIAAMLRQMEGTLGSDEDSATDNPAQDNAAERSLATVPWFYEDGLETRYQQELVSLVVEISESLSERVEKLDTERRTTLKPFRTVEQEITAEIDTLAASRLGRRGSAKRVLEELEELVESEREKVKLRLWRHRDNIIATAIPIMSEKTPGSQVGAALSELSEYAQLTNKEAKARTTALALPRKRPVVMLFLLWLVAIFAPLISFHAGQGVTETTNVELLRSLVPLFWPSTHVAYAALLLLTGIALLTFPVWRRRRRLQNALHDLFQVARELARRADKALESSLKYAQHDYALGWYTLLAERLKALRAGLDTVEAFDQAFAPLHLDEQVSNGELQRLEQSLFPLLQEHPREEWLPLLLQHWPESKEVTLKLPGDPELVVRSRFLAPAAVTGELDVRLDAVPQPDDGPVTGRSPMSEA